MERRGVSCHFLSFICGSRHGTARECWTEVILDESEMHSGDFFSSTSGESQYQSQASLAAGVTRPLLPLRLSVLQCLFPRSSYLHSPSPGSRLALTGREVDCSGSRRFSRTFFAECGNVRASIACCHRGWRGGSALDRLTGRSSRSRTFCTRLLPFTLAALTAMRMRSSRKLAGIHSWRSRREDLTR